MTSEPLLLSTKRDWIQKSLIWMFSTGLLLIFPGAALPATFYVSPHGSDGNPGTQDQPLRTLQGARDRVIGGQLLTEWKDEGEGIYSTQLDRDAYALYENDQPAVMAREPNQGYHEFESVIDFSHLKYREADYGHFAYQGAAVRLWAHWERAPGSGLVFGVRPV